MGELIGTSMLYEFSAEEVAQRLGIELHMPWSVMLRVATAGKLEITVYNRSPGTGSGHQNCDTPEVR